MSGWQQIINFLLGLWIVASAYFVSPENMVINLLTTGGIMSILALWGAIEQHTSQEHREYMQRHGHAM